MIPTMKKIYIALTAMALLTLTSCKDNMTSLSNPDNRTFIREADGSFETQFQALWEGINQSYVFWDVDKTDWDARRDELIALGRELDALGKSGKLDFKSSVIEEKIRKPFLGLIDHHMGITVINPYSQAAFKDKDDYYFMPSDSEVKNRPNYTAPKEFSLYYEVLKKTFGNRLTQGMYDKFVDEEGKNATYLISALIDGCVPYLHMSGYNVSAILESQTETGAQKVLDAFFINIRDLKKAGKLKGVILDNRDNSGGALSDLNYVLALFINEPMDVLYTRTKNGLGKYDYSNWTRNYWEPNSNDGCYVGDLGDIPYVVLQNVNSVSMGEMSTNAISRLSSGVTIGTRTYGGHGTLITSNTYEQNGYNGSYNQIDNEGGHSVYTTNTMSKIFNKKSGQWEVMEGVGLYPDIECALDEKQFSLGTDNQVVRAMDYIKNKQ